MESPRRIFGTIGVATNIIDAKLAGGLVDAYEYHLLPC